MEKSFKTVRKLVQDFRFFLSGNPQLYTDIVEPIGYRAREHNEHYVRERAALVNNFTRQFLDEFCTEGKIDWNRLVQFNSGNLKDL